MELNPGPFEIPPCQIMLEPNAEPDVRIPHIPPILQPRFDFQEYYISPNGRQFIRDRCYNLIYTCPPCGSLNKCYKTFSRLYIKTAIPLSRIMANTITECLLCYRCAQCLTISNQHQSTFLPKGYICSDQC